MTFLKALKGTPDQKLEYLMDQWNKINKKYFKNKLPKPYMRWLKDTGIKMSQRAHYESAHNVFAFSKYFFGAGEAKAIEILKHEVAHQAVRKLDKVLHGEIHGKLFKKWCIHMGITTLSHDYTKTIDYLPPEKKTRLLKYVEKQKQDYEQKQIDKKNKEKELANKQISPYLLRNDLPAQWYNPDKKDWVKGIIVCPNDKAAKRWAFISSPWSSSWMIIPSDWFYELSTKDKKIYSDESYKLQAAKIRKSIQDKKDMKAMKKGFRKLIW